MNLKEANDRFNAGDAITDDELDLLIAQYQQVFNFFSAINENQFDLFENAIYWRLNKLKGYKEERKGY